MDILLPLHTEGSGTVLHVPEGPRAAWDWLILGFSSGKSACLYVTATISKTSFISNNGGFLLSIYLTLCFISQLAHNLAGKDSIFSGLFMFQQKECHPSSSTPLCMLRPTEVGR
jgi:hypothetical protein